MQQHSESLARIPFDLNFYHICLQAQIGESEPLCLRLDTGAQLSILDMQAAQRIGLPLQAIDGQAAGVGNNALQISSAQDVCVRIGETEVLFPQILVAPIGAEVLTAYTGKATHGILGYDFICRYVMDIDYAEKMIALYDPESYQYSDAGTSIPLMLKNNHPHIQAEIVLPDGEHHPIDLILDTGASPALVLATPIVDSHRLLEGTIQTLPTLLGGAGGLVPAAGGYIPQLRFGDVTVEKPYAYLSRSKEDGISELLGADGVLGADILRRYKVIVDYPHQQLVLEPNTQVTEPYEYDLCGLFMTAEGKDLNVFKIVALAPGNVAEEADFRVGDEILSIDGRPAERFTLEEIYLTFTREKDYTLMIERDGERLEKVLKLRKWLG
jgi:predicted aspartyl protease